MNADPFVVTIDGPAGVGKSTVGRAVAARLRLPFVDTGLFYRVLALAAAEAGVGPDGAAQLARRLSVELNRDPLAPESAWRARLGSRELGPELWAPGEAELLAQIAAQPEVRAVLLPMQRRLASEGVVAVGRDTGSTVFPDADCKVYLDAPSEVRMARRRAELSRLGLASAAAAVGVELEERDRRDRTREAAPLTVPPGALVIDTTSIPASGVVDLVLDRCRALGREPAPPGRGG